MHSLTPCLSHVVGALAFLTRGHTTAISIHPDRRLRRCMDSCLKMWRAVQTLPWRARLTGICLRGARAKMAVSVRHHTTTLSRVTVQPTLLASRRVSSQLSFCVSSLGFRFLPLLPFLVLSCLLILFSDLLFYLVSSLLSSVPLFSSTLPPLSPPYPQSPLLFFLLILISANTHSVSPSSPTPRT